MELEENIAKNINYIKKFIESININDNYYPESNEEKQTIGSLYYAYITINNIAAITKEYKGADSKLMSENELLEIFNDIILKVVMLKFSILKKQTKKDTIPFLSYIKKNEIELNKFINENFKDTNKNYLYS